MPIYDYACDGCGKEFEVEQRITDDPLKTCPTCRSRKVKRLISQTSFVLKGGGWYSDLYSSNKQDKSKSGDDKDTGKGTGDEKSDSKKSEKSDSKSGSDKPTGSDKGSSGKGGKGSKGAKAAA